MRNIYWQRKFHIKHKLPDGNIYKGFINIEADTREELPTTDQISGSYWAEKTSEGWLGRFELDCGFKPDNRKNADTQMPYVITTGIYREVKPRNNNGYISREEAEAILNNIMPIKYDTVPRFEGRLEDAIVSEETHRWEL